MRKTIIIFLLCGCLLCSGCITGSEEDHAKDIVRAYYAAYNNRDAEAIVDLFTDEVIESAGGRQTMVDNLKNVFNSADETNLNLKIIRFLNVRIINDGAKVNFDVNLHDDSRDMVSNLTFNMRKVDGKWKIEKMIEEG